MKCGMQLPKNVYVCFFVRYVGLVPQNCILLIAEPLLKHEAEPFGINAGAHNSICDIYISQRGKLSCVCWSFHKKATIFLKRWKPTKNNPNRFTWFPLKNPSAEGKDNNKDLAHPNGQSFIATDERQMRPIKWCELCGAPKSANGMTLKEVRARQTNASKKMPKCSVERQ